MQTTHYCQLTVADKWDMKSVRWKWIQIRGAGSVGLYKQLGIVFNSFTSRDAQCTCAYFRLECGVEVCEEGVLPGEGQDSLLDHGALHIIIHKNYILLQDLHSKVQPLPLQLCQQHLRCQSHLEWVLHQCDHFKEYNHRKIKPEWGYLYLLLSLVFLHARSRCTWGHWMFDALPAGNTGPRYCMNDPSIINLRWLYVFVRCCLASIVIYGWVDN